MSAPWPAMTSSSTTYPASGSKQASRPSTAISPARSTKAGSPKNSAMPSGLISDRTQNSNDLGDCDLVIESAVEDEAVKRQIFVALCPVAQGQRIARLQHLVDFDHPPGRHHRPARAVHGHSLHEPGAGHGTGRTGARHRHRRRAPSGDRQGICQCKPRQDHRRFRGFPGLHGQPHPAADDQRGDLHAL